jgi:hypothetical protein
MLKNTNKNRKNFIKQLFFLFDEKKWIYLLKKKIF